ncbi:MAG: heme-binding domain-containing protein [Rhodothermales bacterium]|nr:heme-binding domain-containing protein [Rhodothermales bacterium]
MKFIVRLLAYGIPAVLILIQFFPVDRTNPPATRELRWDSPQTREIAERACFDCHSNQTKWPWYAYIAPLSWRVADHVAEGREHMNFSEWDRPNENFEEIEEVINEGEMPLWDYLILHGEAKLTPDETQVLLAGLKASFDQDPPIERQRRPPPGAPAP